jgi:DNA-directed RNA polymerase subunit RPC12/RpoP
MENMFVKIGSYQYSSEAVIIKGRLESEGVKVFMGDNFTIDTDPLVSNAIGGVKLFVKNENLEQAQSILSEISRFSLDNEGELMQCPKCGMHKIELGSTVTDIKSLLAFLLGFILGLFPFYTRYKYRCSNCGHEFNLQ